MTPVQLNYRMLLSTPDSRCPVGAARDDGSPTETNDVVQPL